MQAVRHLYALMAVAIMLCLCMVGCLDSVDSEDEDDSQLELLSLARSDSTASIDSTVIHSLKLINHAKQDKLLLAQRTEVVI